MRKIQISKAGGYEQLAIVEQPEPKCGPQDVRIDVAAVGVNYADCVVRMGLYTSAKEYVGWPITPGFEVAGRVGALGSEVEDLEVGQPVIGLTRFGAYATQVVVPRAQAFPMPKAMGMQEAGAFSVASLTAWYALCEQGGLRSSVSEDNSQAGPQRTVLIHSVAGGVGTAAVQIAKICGARTIGVVGASHKVEHAKRSGTDVVIDKSSQKLWEEVERVAPEGVDLVLDPNGQQTLGQSYKHLKPTGRLVIYGFQTMLSRGKARPSWLKLAWTYLRTPRFNPLLMTNDNKSVMAFNLSYLFDEQTTMTRAMGELLTWAEEGRLGVPEVTTYPFSSVAEAHTALESGETQGKLVLVP